MFIRCSVHFFVHYGSLHYGSVCEASVATCSFSPLWYMFIYAVTMSVYTSLITLAIYAVFIFGPY